MVFFGPSTKGEVPRTRYTNIFLGGERKKECKKEQKKKKKERKKKGRKENCLLYFSFFFSLLCLIGKEESHMSNNLRMPFLKYFVEFPEVVLFV